MCLFVRVCIFKKSYFSYSISIWCVFSSLILTISGHQRLIFSSFAFLLLEYWHFSFSFSVHLPNYSFSAALPGSFWDRLLTSSFISLVCSSLNPPCYLWQSLDFHSHSFSPPFSPIFCTKTHTNDKVFWQLNGTFKDYRD